MCDARTRVGYTKLSHHRASEFTKFFVLRLRRGLSSCERGTSGRLRVRVRTWLSADAENNFSKLLRFRISRIAQASRFAAAALIFAFEAETSSIGASRRTNQPHTDSRANLNDPCVHPKVIVKNCFFDSCKSTKIWVGRSQVRNSVPAKTLHCGISVEMYPSSYDLYTQHQFMREMYWWLYICFTWERCDMSSINKRSTRVVATFKKECCIFYFHTCPWTYSWTI